MLHHLSFGVADLRAAADFYDAVLRPLGYERVWTDFDGEPDRQAVGYGLPGGGDKFALKQCPKGGAVPGPGFHLAFSAPSRDAVDRFHEAALRHGAVDNGAPGLRPRYGPDYYAAFVIDPEGNRIEAVISTAA
ncbi:VOC family protein [Pigmentiphaga sp. GD03639]|uniref:VOC family protein n=1 Tax=Pigmentiphaga daeguensis TaxID=414049 RepID=A0ABN1C365_9BURK|nr:MULTISPECIES: VOC family protein [unclassified Pigmentiphaga]MDH2239377.1 VOC family protein [Pigmentiphaga sp. GD03639]OVZ65379.1 glyoxalase/bleomycin resistance/extradiol dioxygenase family protein [Pigmentiphaga sp. NML030171]